MKLLIGFLGILFAMFLTSPVQAQQKYKLANEYYNAGEYEKAASLFESLYTENPKNKSYFNWYIQCLMDLRQFEKASKSIQAELKKNPDDVSLYVTNGNLLERQGFQDKATQEYQKAISSLGADLSAVTSLANTFTTLAKYDFAIETYLKGEKLAKVENLYVYNLADLYRRQGDVKNMIKYYLMTAEKEGTTANVQTSLQRFLGQDDYVELQKQLYQKIQEKPDKPYYGELLQWTFTHKKEYEKALRQAKALDIQFEENGSRVFVLADIIFKDGDYINAIEAYKYIVNQHGKNNSYYLEARRGLLNSKKARITESYNYTREDLEGLKSEYVVFLNDLGRNTQTATLMQEFADFEALYLNELDTAIAILEELRQFGGLHPEMIAKTKLALGDYYLMNGDRWEASLLFSQVDKDFKEGQMGEYARYRNAKLSYYSGDFEWAQEQFKILKGATSKLISNDAIDMSVFILDNLGMDSTETTLKMFAEAELFSFQNKFDEALEKLDSIPIVFPQHSLEDDVLYEKAHIFRKLRKTDEMIKMYQAIIEKYSDEIRADNALFELAEFYEVQLNDVEKSKPLYEKLFLDYASSTFAAEARNRFRKLRGDEL
jgi:tetratricopeptide (TPR) repeat protein